MVSTVAGSSYILSDGAEWNNGKFILENEWPQIELEIETQKIMVRQTWVL